MSNQHAKLGRLLLPPSAHLAPALASDKHLVPATASVHALRWRIANPHRLRPSSRAAARVSCWRTSCANTFSRLGSSIRRVSSEGAASATTLPSRDDDHAIAHLLHNFEHVRDVQHRLARRGQLLQQIAEQPRRQNVQPRQRLVEDQHLRVVHQRCRHQHALPHALRVRRHRRMPPRLESQQLQHRLRLLFDQPLAHAAQPAHQLQILHRRHPRVQVRFLRDVSKRRAPRVPDRREYLCPRRARARRWAAAVR